GGAQRPRVEDGSRRFRRSLYAIDDIAPGAALTRDNVRSIRPGFGLPPRELPAVLGKHARVAIARGTPLTWELIR
ncbi:MAG TPA: SAF domain-containing protein, partial [Kofleriaceae bacterium]